MCSSKARSSRASTQALPPQPRRGVGHLRSQPSHLDTCHLEKDRRNQLVLRVEVTVEGAGAQLRALQNGSDAEPSDPCSRTDFDAAERRARRTLGSGASFSRRRVIGRVMLSRYRCAGTPRSVRGHRRASDRSRLGRSRCPREPALCSPAHRSTERVRRR